MNILFAKLKTIRCFYIYTCTRSTDIENTVYGHVQSMSNLLLIFFTLVFQHISICGNNKIYTWLNKHISRTNWTNRIDASALYLRKKMIDKTVISKITEIYCKNWLDRHISNTIVCHHWWNLIYLINQQALYQNFWCALNSQIKLLCHYSNDYITSSIHWLKLILIGFFWRKRKLWMKNTEF